MESSGTMRRLGADKCTAAQSGIGTMFRVLRLQSRAKWTCVPTSNLLRKFFFMLTMPVFEGKYKSQGALTDQ
jgi:hypothetical protein